MITLRVVEDRIQVTSPFAFKSVLETLPGGRWSRTESAWTFPAAPIAAGNLRGALRGTDEKMMADKAFRALLAESDLFADRQGLKALDDLPQPEVRKTDAWNHQRQAFHFAHDMPAVLLDMEMGTGKTKVVIDLIQNRGHERILIACPNTVVRVWPREFEKHGAIKVKIVAPQTGGIARRVAETKLAFEQARIEGVPAVVVVNHEAFWQGDFGKWLPTAGLDLVVYDEIHRLKSPGGKQSRFAQKLSRKVPYRLGLTGTPMPHSPLDVYGEMRALDESVFGTSFVRFRNRYAVMGGWEGREVVGYRNEPELREKIGAVTYSVGADVLDLPEAHHIDRFCVLTPSAWKAYSSLETEFYTDVKDGTVTVSNALVKLLRMQQVTSGHVGLDESDGAGKRKVTRIDDSKEKLLADVLEDLKPDEPVVIFCRFTDDLQRVHEVAKKLGRGSAELSGGRKELDAWEREDGPPILAVQMQSGGVGIDLTRASYCIYYSVGFSLGEYQQSLARVHRPGQDRPVTYIHLLAEGTIDVKVKNALAERADVVKSVMYGDSERVSIGT